jgi:4-oxalocrotonate tautomerase
MRRFSNPIVALLTNGVFHADPERQSLDGTNTKDEKARYIAEAYAFFSQLLGELHPESYVYVQDVRAEAYGFGGKTQEYRYIKAQA